MSDAFKDTPQLFSEYIWHATIGSEEMRNTVREEKNKVRIIFRYLTIMFLILYKKTRNYFLCFYVKKNYLRIKKHRIFMQKERNILKQK